MTNLRISIVSRLASLHTRIMALHDCRIVLVQPQIAANIGGTARIMRNMGLQRLFLVKPRVDPITREALRTSTHGEEILRTATITTDFLDAVRDCVMVVAASARTGGLYRKQSAGQPASVLEKLLPALGADKPVALVFGPERTGLTNDVIVRCHYLLHIPTDDNYPAMNLAHAVAVCLFQLRQLWLADDTRQAVNNDDSATFEEQEFLFDQLKTSLEDIHFLYGQKANSLMHAIRHVLGRARLSKMETKVLLGMAQQIRWYVQNSNKRDDG